MNKKREIIVFFISDMLGVDLLQAAYHKIGILKYQDDIVSGERYLISNVLRKYFYNIERSNPVLFDVGANIGNYSKALKTELPQAIIYAFEPNPVAYKIMQSRLKEVNINLLNLGLGSKKTKATMFNYEGNIESEHGSLYKDVFLDLHKMKDVIEIEIEITTIDNFCSDNRIKYIDFLKIDTEGNELEVLKGANTMLHKHNVGIIQFEFNEMNVISRVFLKDFFEVLEEYIIYRLDSSNLIQLPRYDTRYEIFQFQNLIAISKQIFPCFNKIIS